MRFDEVLQRIKAHFNKNPVKDAVDRQGSKTKSKWIKIGVFFVLFFCLILFMKSRQQKIRAEKQTPDSPGEIDLGMESDAIQDTWYSKSNETLETINRRMEQLEKRFQQYEDNIEGKKASFDRTYQRSIDQLAKERGKILRETREAQRQAVDESVDLVETALDERIDLERLDPKTGKGFSKTLKGMSGSNPPGNGQRPELHSKYPAPPVAASQTAGKALGKMPSSSESPSGGAGDGRAQKTGQMKAGLITMTIEPRPLLSRGDSAKKGDKKELEAGKFILPGSFVNCTLLTGIDAPTGLKAAQKPHPVLMKVNQPAQLPNSAKMNIKGCFILGEAYGDLSAERAYVRTTGLSCVTDQNEVISTPVEGYISGEDGSLGMRGKVVSKTGAILARYIVASFLQGVSEAFAAVGFEYNTTFGGSTSTIKSGKALQTGIASGGASAANSLAQMYEKLAKDIFPIIEINSGRRGHVVFLNEVSLDPTKKLKT